MHQKATQKDGKSRQASKGGQRERELMRKIEFMQWIYHNRLLGADVLAYEFVCILARNKIEINVNNLDKFNPHPGVKV